MLETTRRQVLAYRIAAHGLRRETGDPLGLEVLDLGVQFANTGALRQALASRLPEGARTDVLVDDAFALLWSFRGAPHLLRRADVPGLIPALWPVSEADAMSRLAAERQPLKRAGIGGLEAFTETAQAFRAVVTGPMTKGEVSAAITRRLPAAYSYECRRCEATHVYGGLFQLAALAGGVELVPGAATTALTPLPDRPDVPTSSTGPTDQLRAYLRLHGPATPADAGSYLGTTAGAVRPWWPEDAVEVTVEGRRCWITEDRLDALREPPSAGGLVRLLPPHDPFLQARDRDLLVPSRERQKEIWRILGNPGAVLAGGELAGIWRAKPGRKGSLDVSVLLFDELPAKARRALEAEAGRLAAHRGAADVQVVYQTASD